MGAGDISNALDVASIAREFERVRRGYDPAAVDHHLALLTSQVKNFLAQGPAEPDESLDLVLQATRRSVDEALADARTRADAIVAAAEEEAQRVTTEAEQRCRALDAEGRERYAEMGRLTDARATQLAALDTEIEARRGLLRTAADQLVTLAGAMTPEAPAVPSIAAMPASPEIVLPAQPGSDA